MAKIYNEVIIDMNPESPTFEETIYEDSFEHEGDMILAQRGVYQGRSTQSAQRYQSLWDILQGQKRHTEETEGQLGKRKIFSKFSDIVEKGIGYIPGFGKILKPMVDIGSKQLEQKLFELPEYEEEPSFWGSGAISKYKDKAEDWKEGANVSLLESILGKFSEEGEGGLMAGVESFVQKMFSDQGMDINEGGYDHFSPDFMSQYLKRGGRVPKKYYGGGNVQGGAPTILDYFGKQGLSLGGNNIQSLAEKLGRK